MSPTAFFLYGLALAGGVFFVGLAALAIFCLCLWLLGVRDR